MKQATRRFLKMRPNATVIPKVEHRPHPDARANHCVENAFAEAERSDSKVACGWLVGDYDKKLDATPIMFHFINVDADGNYYDVTPLSDGAKQVYDFLEDSDVYYDSREWSKEVLGNGELHFPPSIKMTSKTVMIALGDVLSGDNAWLPIEETTTPVKNMLSRRYALETLLAEVC